MKPRRKLAKVERYSQEAIDRKDFKLVSIPEQLPEDGKKEISEMNGLILIWKNYQTTKEEIEEATKRVVDKLLNLI